MAAKSGKEVFSVSAETNAEDTTATTTTAGGNVVLRTVGLMSAFSGTGFPTVVRKGTKMTRAEADIAIASAKNSHVKLEEVNG